MKAKGIMSTKEKDQIIVERIKLTNKYMNKPSENVLKDIHKIDKELEIYYNTRNKV